MSEAELVTRFLAGPALRSELVAWEARVAAAGTAEVVLANPELEYRHEEARGPAGSRTDAVGATVTVDLGLTDFVLRSAAQSRSLAMQASRDGAILEAVCSLRREASALWFAEQEHRVRSEAQSRLDELAATLAKLAAAGEASGFDRDRAALAAAAHSIAVSEADGEAGSTRASLERRVGGDVPGLDLANSDPPGDLDALQAVAREDHPDLVSLRRAAVAAERSKDAAWRMGLPDLRITGAARFDALPEGGDATGGYEIGAALEIPLFDRAQHEVATAEAESREVAATLRRRQLEVAAAVEAAHRRATASTGRPWPAVDPGELWVAARERYVGGEASIDDLLQAAGDVEDAELSVLAAGRLVRAARVDLDCAVGRFDDPAIQSALEEALP